MKKLLLITFAVMITSNLFAQTSDDPIYVVFTSIPQKVNVGVVFGSIFDPKTDRTPTRGYFFIDTHKEYFQFFGYNNYLKDPDNPIITKPLSFLESVNYIDWDAIAPSLTRVQAEQKFEEIKSHKTIYFIDRREIENNTINLVPVEVFESAEY